MIRFSVFALCLLASVAPAVAFDCSGAVPLAVNGPALNGTMGISPEITFAQCGNTFPSNTSSTP